MSEHKNILKSASVMSALIVVSRLTGFLRDIFIAGVFGTGAAAQAFFVAFKIPNMFRDILGEGAGNAAFVPVFSEHLARFGRPGFLRLVKTLFVAVFLFSSAVALFGIIFAHPIVRLIAPGFAADASKLELTTGLARLIFPYLVLVSLSAYSMSVSCALRSFAAPAASSIAFNIVLILSLFFLRLSAGAKEPSIFWLGGAVLAGGCAQLFVQLPPLKRHGINFRNEKFSVEHVRDDPVRKVGRLMLPRLLGSSVYQLNIFVDTIFASLAVFVGDGAIAAIYYANRIIQLPLAIFGVSLSNAALPSMSVHSAKSELESFQKMLIFLFKTVLLSVIPLAAGILVLATPLVHLIFERGQFDVYSTTITSRAVFYYGLGLAGYAGVRLFSTAFYALQDTATPVKGALAALLSNVILNSIFIFVLRWGIAGLALASSISAGLNFFFLYARLKAKIGLALGEYFWRLARKAAAAAAGMIIVVVVFIHLWPFFVSSFAGLLGIMFLGGAVYAGLLWLGKVEEVRGLLAWLQRKT